jgi:hypothetical protein
MPNETSENWALVTNSIIVSIVQKWIRPEKISAEAEFYSMVGEDSCRRQPALSPW